MSNKPTIMVVDDEASIRESFDIILEEKFNVILVASGEAALRKLSENKINLIFLDIRMQGMDGIETLRRIREIDKQVEIIMVTAFLDVQLANQAVRYGAFDYIVKPFDAKDIINRAEKLLRKKELFEEAKAVRMEAKKPAPEGLVGHHAIIREIYNSIDDFAARSAPLLIIAEQGTEKNYLAKIMHKRGPRIAKSFIKIDCYPDKKENEYIVELFGEQEKQQIHIAKKGLGVLEEVGDGTLYINNIDLMPLSVQKILFPILESRKYEKEPGVKPIDLNFRLIVSASQSLKTLAHEGQFYEELIGTVLEDYIELPPLRDRIDDINMFITLFFQKYNNIYDKNIKGFAPDVVELLQHYSWPGNISELDTLVENCVMKYDGEFIEVDQMPLNYLLQYQLMGEEFETNKRIPFDKMANHFEKLFIENTINECAGDHLIAAKKLKILPQVLENKLG